MNKHSLRLVGTICLMAASSPFALAATIVPFKTLSTGASPGAAPNCYAAVAGSSSLDEEWCYGETYLGGKKGSVGSLYRVKPDGSRFKTLFTFDVFNGLLPAQAPVLSPDRQHLYGNTTQGGSYGCGIIYDYNLATGTITTLASYTGAQGSTPQAPPILVDGVLYGIAGQGGSTGYGVVWSLQPDQPDSFTVLHTFAGGTTDTASPFGALTYNPADGLLYGMAFTAAENHLGGIFSLNPDGSGYQLRASFTPESGGVPQMGALVRDPATGIFYGSGWVGGANKLGTLFAFDPSTNQVSPVFAFTQSSGTQPYSGPVLSSSGNWLYVVTWLGGSDVKTVFGQGYGTILAVKKDGSDSKVLYTFNKKSGGLGFSSASLSSDGTTLITTTGVGAKYGVGAIVSIKIPVNYR